MTSYLEKAGGRLQKGLVVGIHIWEEGLGSEEEEA